MKLPLPEDPVQRGFAVAVVCSILLHLLLLGSLVWAPKLRILSPQKKGETLFVDLAPDKPEEKAPLGNPARPPAPPPSPERAIRPPEPPAPRPRVAAPPIPPVPAVRPAPQPPRQVAKASPPSPEPPAKSPPAPAPEPAPAPPPPQATAPREEPAPSSQAKPAEPARQAPAPGSAPSETQTALARPRPEGHVPGIFRSPGGGGGLQGGRGRTAGEPIPLDTPDPNYREYMQRVKQRIYAKWGYPYEAQAHGLQGKLVIEFHIAKDGHLQFIELRESSGEEILDSFAMTAVKLAQVYDPLPEAMRRDVLPIVAVFVYTLRGPLSVLQTVQ